MMIKKLIVAISIIAIGLYLTFYMLIPYFVIKPLPLYCIENEDSIVHNVTIEITDNSEILLKENYTLNPNDEVCYERSLGWYPKIMWYPITWSEGIYTFRVYVEGKPLKEHKSKFSILKTVYVKVYSENSVFVSELVV